jgi:hypothetical protein
MAIEGGVVLKLVSQGLSIILTGFGHQTDTAGLRKNEALKDGS